MKLLESIDQERVQTYREEYAHHAGGRDVFTLEICAHSDGIDQCPQMVAKVPLVGPRGSIEEVSQAVEKFLRSEFPDLFPHENEVNG